VKKDSRKPPAGVGHAASTTQTAVGTARKRGRPPGKRSDPDFEQVTIYIRKTTHRQAKIELLKGETRREFSELVEQLVYEWLPD